MNAHWIYTVPGSLIFAAILAWPVSRQESQSLFERLRFCLLTMVAFALLIWGLRQPSNGFNREFSFFTVDGSVVAVMAMGFLILLWMEKGVGLMADVLLGCIDFAEANPAVPDCENTQMDKAVQLYRRGKRRRALRLCNRIIESHGTYSSTAATLSYWIENPGRLKFIAPPRTPLRFKGRFASLNRLWIF